ncbi:P-loop containing nucleoside triphosphate hydrolase protein [Mycena amicta]|nr:P-loop containing nucleoside triphosphate hydrolase protein [Mycena amicta]
MRLCTLPDLQFPTQNLVSCLDECGIRTEIDLLFSATTIDIFRRLPAGTTTLAQLDDFKGLVAELAAAPGLTAESLIDTYAQDHTELLSGSPLLDQLLSGITGPRQLLEVSGDRGSGKTSLVLYLILRHLVSRPQSSVLWIDTTGDFSVPWAAEMLESMENLDGTDALDRLQIAHAFEVDTVFQVLEGVKTSHNNPSNAPTVRAIVVDNIASILSPLLSPVSFQGHAIMTTLMRQLRGMAQNSSMTIFVLNNSVAVDSSQLRIRKPALGPSFTFMTDATLWCAVAHSKDDDHKKHVLQLYRTKISARKELCAFRIRGGIVEDWDVVEGDGP